MSFLLLFPVLSPPHHTPSSSLPHILSPATYLFHSLHPFRLTSTPLPRFAFSMAPPSSSHLPLQPRLLEHQLQTQRRSYDSDVEALRGELQSVKEENNRQQQLLAQNLQLPPEARIEASLQHEITRLTNENLVRCNTHREAYRLRKSNYFNMRHTTLSPHMYKYTHRPNPIHKGENVNITTRQNINRSNVTRYQGRNQLNVCIASETSRDQNIKTVLSLDLRVFFPTQWIFIQILI